MSTKQGRKRKNRQNVRERTVLTLTEDPSTQFLVPTASTELAGNLMSAPFPITSTSGGINGTPPGAFQPHGNFPGFGFNTFLQSPVNGQQQNSQQNLQLQQASMLRNQYQDHIVSTGNSDLDRLERLKKEILDGQNPFYKATPQPSFLESIYLGHTSQGQAAVPVHPEQMSSTTKPATGAQLQSGYVSRSSRDNASIGADENSSQNQASQHRATPIAANGPSSQSGNNSATGTSSNASRGNTQAQASVASRLDHDGTGNHASPKDSSTARNGLHVTTPTSVPPSSPVITRASRFGDSGIDSTEAGKYPGQVPPNNQPNARHMAVTEKSVVPNGESRQSGQPNASSLKSAGYDGKDFSRRPGDSSWNRDGPPDDRYRRPSVPYLDNHSEARHIDSKPSDTFDRNRERDRERDRSIDKERERERDRERDRRLDGYRPDDRRIDDHPRTIDRRPIQSDPRDIRLQDGGRYESRPGDESIEVVGRRPVTIASDRTIRPPLENRISRAIPLDDRQSRGPPPDERLARAIPSDDRLGRAPPPADDRPPRSVIPDDRHSRPVDDRARLPLSDDRAARAGPSLEDRINRPPTALEERIGGRGHAALEERIGSRAPPALEDRIGARQTPALDDRNANRPPPALQERIGGRPPPLEERIGNRPPPPPVADDRSRSHVPEFSRPAHDDRLIRPPPLDDRSTRPPDARVSPPEVRGASQDVRAIPRPDDRTIRGPVDERPRTAVAEDRAPPPRSVAPVGYVPEPGSTPLVHDSSRAPFASSRPPSPRRIDPLNRTRDEPRDRLDTRPGAPPYRNEADRRYPDDRRMDVGSPDRFVPSRLPYHERESAPVDDRTRPSLEGRQWRERESYPPLSSSSISLSTRAEPYGGPDADRRFPPPVSDSREWLPPSDDRNVNPWLRDRSLTREPERDRFTDRDAAKGVWDASSRDDRRSSAPLPPPPRSWDRDEPSARSVAARVPELYPPEDRHPHDLERARYPPHDFIPRDSSRVRARSPSPIRRGPGSVDDLRPIKRAREEPPFYDAERRGLGPPDFHSRAPSPPPSSASSFYDPRTAPFSTRDIRDPPYSARERPGDLGFYDRRGPDMPPPRSPPYNGRGVYTRNESREDRRYGMPPPRSV